ncbi:MAG: PAS domain S-box protein [Zoogloeaceae bacterium]|nr:PAS domain S-box protein [Zoogloeaceae bacterium]MCK6385869.1 PAS domain S-box protein [Rhodocyclaceae bacterium]
MALKLRTLSRLTTLGAALALLLTLAAGWAVQYALDEAAQAADWVAHSLEVQRDLEHVKTDLRTAQAMARGHVLFGYGETLAQYRASIEDLHRQLAALRALTAGNPAQQRALDELAGPVAAYARYLDRLLEIREERGLDAARREFVGGAGHPQVVEAIARIDAVAAIEERLLSERRAALERSNAHTGTALFLAGALVLAILVASVVALRREIRRRQAAEQAARVLNEGLDAQVAARTAALKQWETIFRKAGWGVVTVDPQTFRVAAANPAAEAMLRAARPLAGRPIDALFPPEERALLPERVRRVGEQGHLSYESAWLRDDGTTLPVNIEVAVYRGDDGRLWRVANVQDISERKRAEAALAQSAALFRQLAEIGSDYFWELDEAFRFTSISPQIRERAGLNYESYIGKARWELPFLGMDAAKWAAHRADLEAHRPFRNLEAGLVNLHGEARWFLIGGDPVFDAGGGFLGYRGVTHDITAVKQAEASLREREEQLNLFVQYAPAAIAMFDRDMRYLAWSRRWSEDYGLGGRELAGRSHYEIFPEIPQRWRDIHRRCLAGATESSEADPFVRQDGRTQWLKWIVLPWHRPDGGIGGIAVFSEDITERKQAEDAQRDSAQRLETLSRRLLQVQEEERRAIARELHDEIGQALTAVKLSLAALRRRAAGGEEDAMLADGIGVIDHAIAQVRDRSLDLRPLMLDDIGLAGTLEWLVGRLQAKVSLRITAEIAPLAERPEREVETAAFRIAQEALTNALRHAGARRVEVSLWQEDGQLCLAVADDGKGFDTAATRAGFGLSGMRERAILLGGEFMIDSSPGAGTCIRASLPNGVKPGS